MVWTCTPTTVIACRGGMGGVVGWTCWHGRVWAAVLTGGWLSGNNLDRVMLGGGVAHLLSACVCCRCKAAAGCACVLSDGIVCMTDRCASWVAVLHFDHSIWHEVIGI